jgi:hypothetical protein
VLQWLPEQLPQEWEEPDPPALSLFPPDEMAQQLTSFFTLALPHFSHCTESAADMVRRNFSKTRPHFRHL